MAWEEANSGGGPSERGGCLGCKGPIKKERGGRMSVAWKMNEHDEVRDLTRMPSWGRLVTGVSLLMG